ncbi:hypothetical protein F3Y22_tig00111342pilonHSYRG00178 [Hibiscus syriacus]|uniref:Receptor like protein 33 n=1 Tax=Hibiscus syriacus TaxID=106335 RepID=A0A6A2YP97_HIBSY|nr:hypothetical protein F3Y22_tig00111342pilonHSYRG00178 [Hibiscus syriacus]
MFQEDKREQVHVNSSWLVLSNNNLTGSIPDPVSELVNLTLLDLSSNNLSGSFELDKLSRFGKLQHLYLSDNTLLSFTSASNVNYSSPDLSTLNLSSCNTSEFPNFVSNLPATTFDEQEADSEFGLEAKMASWNGSKSRLSLRKMDNCSLVPGDVTGLDLSCSCLVGLIPSNSNLFRLGQLRELDLSNNDFESSPITSEFGDLKSLEILYLSYCNLTGPIPASLGNLTQLKTLALSHNQLSGLIPFSVFNLPRVEFLDLSYNNLIGSLPSRGTLLVVFSPILFRLALSNNNLTGPIPDPVFELVNITLLDLSSNNLSGSFELNKLSRFRKVMILSLSDNALLSFTSASNPDYSLPNLSTLNLSSCNTSEFPNFVRNLPGLMTLDLSRNKIRFIDADMFANLTNLQELDLSHNSPLSFSNINNLTLVLPVLRTLLMSSCNITQLSNFLTTQESLTHLDLSNNNIRGRITEQENNWGSNLEILDLSNNLLTTIEYYAWKNVETLNLRSNLLEGPLLVPPLSTQVFLISNNRLTGEIPSSMCNIGFDSNTFDLSHNNLSGAIPKCMAYAKLVRLYLQTNHFHGVIPDFCVEDYMLNSLNLNDNDFEGPVPKSLANCENLEVLNLGNNKINDTFPYWLGTLPWLQVLALRSNHFHGRISPLKNGSDFSSLRILDLSYNEFSGSLPTSYFKIFKSMMNLSQVQMGYRSSYYEDSVVITMKGIDIELKRILTIFATIDMSSNRFEGTISETVGNLISLKVLNFSHNHLTGHIPSSLGKMTALESLDLSDNKLAGGIPSQLTDLNFLSTLNLSENQLVGPIPKGKQFNTFENDSYIGNIGLCGFPVSESCGQSEPPPAATTFDEQEADSELGLDWKIVIMSYGCGAEDDDCSSVPGCILVIAMKGVEVELKRILTIFATIDMSSNRFEGTIPETVGNLVSLNVLNFSHNHLTGQIPSALGNLATLESLDLSYNVLVGKIPSQLTDLNFLAVLNLSENQLVGLIPQGKQFNTFMNDSYVGNPGLCGFPVSKSCGRSEPPPATTFDEQEADSTFRLEWKSIIMGYGCGAVLGFSAGYIMMTIRKPKWLVGMIQRAGNKVLRTFKKKHH